MDASTATFQLPPEPVESWALFLDFDGTLVDIAPTPESVIVPPGLIEALRRIDRLLAGALAVVSGRPINQIDTFLAPLSLPAAGRHGAEIRLRPDQPLLKTPPELDLSPVVGRLDAFARTHPGILIENKGFTVAAHYRNAPAYESQLRAEIVEIQKDLGPNWQVMTGKMVFELKQTGFDKGAAVEELMRHPPFAGRVPVFIGDDVTDEYGFAAAARLGGHGIRVGSEPAGEARWTLPDPAALREWLGRIARVQTVGA